MSQDKPNINCVECGAAFRCGVEAGENSCWCFALPQVLSLPQDDEKQGCLCPKCLEARIEKMLGDSNKARK